MFYKDVKEEVNKAPKEPAQSPKGESGAIIISGFSDLLSDERLPDYNNLSMGTDVLRRS